MLPAMVAVVPVKRGLVVLTFVYQPKRRPRSPGLGSEDQPRLVAVDVVATPEQPTVSALPDEQQQVQQGHVVMPVG